MLERQTFQESRPVFQGHDLNEDQGLALSPAYFLEIAKRRALYFLVPFVLVAVIGSFVTIAWPSRYLAEGTILVSSQEIPSDLVRPTVAALANDRIQTIQQRIMTRDNLLAIAKKYQITPVWQGQVSGSDLVDFIRARISITPVTDEFTASNSRKNAIAFKVGFEYENPQVAMGVANELVTMILNEDVRSRTEFATQTVRFLEQEVNRLEAKLGSINKQIDEYKVLNPDDDLSANSGATPKLSENASALASLRSELLVKSATLSEEHPDIKALKRKIEAFEKKIKAADTSRDASKKPAAGSSEAPAARKLNDVGIDTLTTQRLSVREELTRAIQKVSAARLGENMERSQQSERLEMIEQPSLPQRSIKPNKPKVFALVFALAMMAGGGMVLAAESLDKSIRRRADLFPVIDSHLIFSVPYISTPMEAVKSKRRILLTAALLTLVVVAAVAAFVFVLPPIDVLMNKVVTRLTR